MMRISMFTIFLLGYFLAIGQSTFHRTYGGLGEDYGRALAVCTDGGYLVVGSSNSFTMSSTDIYILKLDDNGDFQWSRTIGDYNTIDWALDVVEIPGGDFIIAGYTDDSDGQAYNGLLTRIAPTGDVVWVETYGGIDWDFFNAMELDGDGHLMIAGSRTDDAGQKGWLLKVDFDGNVIWERTLTGLGSLTFNGISICLDGNIYSAGDLNDNLLIERSALISKWSPAGDLLWQQTYPELGDATVYDCSCSESDNRIKFTGNQNATSGGSNITIGYVASIEMDMGAFEWQQTFGSDDENIGRAIEIRNNNNILIAGGASNFGFGLIDGYSSERFPDGISLGTSYGPIYGGFEIDEMFDIQPTLDDGYIVTGQTHSFDNNNQIYVIKFDAMANYPLNHIDYLDLTVGIENFELRDQFTIYPNPATTTLTVASDQLGLNHVRILNVTGEVIQTKKQFATNTQIDVSKLPSGLYIAEITNKGQRTVRRVVILRE